MPVRTVHNYIDVYTPKKTDKRLIIGTIHPHITENFTIPFFYGNKGSFWEILHGAFPQHDFTNLESILSILNRYETSITDIIRECDRENENITRDDLLYNLLLNSEQISDTLNESKIHTIYFTSRFGKNNAAKLFTSALKVDYIKFLDKNESEFIIPDSQFGREIRCIVLYSPSNEANKGIAGGAAAYIRKKDYYKQFKNPIKKFKIEFYREKFQYLNQLVDL